MLSIKTRPINEAERKLLLNQLPGMNDRIEGFIMMVLMISTALLVPLLVYGYFFKVSSTIQAICCVVVIFMAIGGAIHTTIKWEGGFSNAAAIERINNLDVREYFVKPLRALKRDDSDDFGSPYYLEVMHEGKAKVLFLWDQYLDMLEEEFPNTEFEFTTSVDAPAFLDFKVNGAYFKPERILPAFSKADFDSRNLPVNLDLLDMPLDEIK